MKTNYSQPTAPPLETTSIYPNIWINSSDDSSTQSGIEGSSNIPRYRSQSNSSPPYFGTNNVNLTDAGVGYSSGSYYRDVIPNRDNISLFVTDDVQSVAINEDVPLIPKGVSPSLILPNTIISLVFAFNIIFCWAGYTFFERFEFTQIALFGPYPLTYMACSYTALFLILLPAVIYYCWKPNRKAFILPYAIVAELMFVGYLTLLAYLYNRAGMLSIASQNVKAIFFSINLIWLMVISLPWKTERIDVAGAVFCVLLSIGTGLYMVNPSEGWDWSSANNLWHEIAVWLSLGLIFALLVIFTRKSCSEPNSSIIPVLFIHTVIGLLMSTAIACGIEIIPNFSSLQEMFAEDIPWWQVVVTMGFGIFYKVSMLILARSSDLFVLGIAAHLSALGAFITPVLYNVIKAGVSNPQTFVAWVQQSPTGTAGLVCCTIVFVYLQVRMGMLMWRYNRKHNSYVDNSYAWEGFKTTLC